MAKIIIIVIIIFVVDQGHYIHNKVQVQYYYGSTHNWLISEVQTAIMQCCRDILQLRTKSKFT